MKDPTDKRLDRRIVRVIVGDAPCGMCLMADTFTLNVCEPAPGAKIYRWEIRRNGRLYQRSDRRLLTAEKAREHGETVLSRLLSGRVED